MGRLWRPGARLMQKWLPDAWYGAPRGLKRNTAMITRYALFEGHIHSGMTAAFRAPELPLILARFFEGRIHHHITEAHEFVVWLWGGYRPCSLWPSLALFALEHGLNFHPNSKMHGSKSSGPDGNLLSTRMLRQ